MANNHHFNSGSVNGVHTESPTLGNIHSFKSDLKLRIYANAPATPTSVAVSPFKRPQTPNSQNGDSEPDAVHTPGNGNGVNSGTPTPRPSSSLLDGSPNAAPQTPTPTTPSNHQPTPSTPTGSHHHPRVMPNLALEWLRRHGGCDADRSAPSTPTPTLTPTPSPLATESPSREPSTPPRAVATPAAGSANPFAADLRVKLRRLNPFLSCGLCRGYLVESATLLECSHSCTPCFLTVIRGTVYLYSTLLLFICTCSLSQCRFLGNEALKYHTT